MTSRAEPGPAPPSGRPSAHVGLTTSQEASSKDAPRRGRPIPWMRPPPDRPLSAIGIMAPGCVNLGGRTLVGPMGRGVPRESLQSTLLGGSRLVGSAVSTSKEPSPAREASRVVAGRARRASGPSPARAARALSLSTVGRRQTGEKGSARSRLTSVVSAPAEARGPICPQRLPGALQPPPPAPSTRPGGISAPAVGATGPERLHRSTGPARRPHPRIRAGRMTGAGFLAPTAWARRGARRYPRVGTAYDGFKVAETGGWSTRP